MSPQNNKNHRCKLTIVTLVIFVTLASAAAWITELWTAGQPQSKLTKPTILNGEVVECCEERSQESSLGRQTDPAAATGNDAPELRFR